MSRVPSPRQQAGASFRPLPTGSSTSRPPRPWSDPCLGRPPCMSSVILVGRAASAVAECCPLRSVRFCDSAIRFVSSGPCRRSIHLSMRIDVARCLHPTCVKRNRAQKVMPGLRPKEGSGEGPDCVYRWSLGAIPALDSPDTCHPCARCSRGPCGTAPSRRLGTLPTSHLQEARVDGATPAIGASAGRRVLP